MRFPSCKKQNRFDLRLLWLVVLVSFGLQAGCAFRVKLVGEYDEIMDQAVTDLQRKTTGFFSKLKTASDPEASYAANLTFYEEVQGDVGALILRAEIIEQGLKRNPLTRNFKDLQEQYNNLAELHKTSPPPEAYESAAKAFDQSFRAILEYLLSLKWNKVPPDTNNR